MTQENDICLDTPFRLNGGVVIKNRLFKAAMSEQLGDNRHNPTHKLENLYRRWAQGGIGVSVSGNIMVDRRAIGEIRNVVLDDESDLDKFRRWTTAGRSNNTHFWAQLNHPGKQAPKLLCKNPVAPSAIGLSGKLRKKYNTPRALDHHEIEAIIAMFAHSAYLAKIVGFTGVQIHGAHGYLISQFLSPRHNQRQDKWGGSLRNRMRFVLEVYQEIRQKVGLDFPVAIKLNSADFLHGGFTESESIEVVKSLAAAGIDQIEISGGTYESPAMMGGVRKSTLEREAYFLAYAEKVRHFISTPLVVTGGFRSAQGMLKALRSGATDFIGIARPVALDPDMPDKLISEKNFQLHLRNLTTGINALDQIASVNVYWYEHQMQRMGKCIPPQPQLSAWVILFKVLINNSTYMLRRKLGVAK